MDKPSMGELRDKVICALQNIEGYRGLEHERQADAILELFRPLMTAPPATSDLIERLQSLIPILEAHHCSAGAIVEAVDALSAVMSDEVVKSFGAALSNLSDSLRETGFFSGQAKHIERYEAVIAEWNRLSAALSASGVGESHATVSPASAVPWDVDRQSDAVVDPQLRDTIGELASGALVMWNDGFCRLVRHLPQPDQHVFDVLIHRGWVEDLANGSGYRISEAGRLAHLRSTDELRDGRLIHPEGWQA